jgi:hypothetical protein
MTKNELKVLGEIFEYGLDQLCKDGQITATEATEQLGMFAEWYFEKWETLKWEE